MTSITNKISIADACAPTAGTTTSNSQTKRIWSLTQAGPGIAGQDARILSCVIDRRTGPHGNYQGETPFAVVGEIQAHSGVAAHSRPVEFRPVFTMDGTTGLLYRKLPIPGFSNSWLDSGQVAVQSWVGNWGQITSNHSADIYQFEALNFPGRQHPTFPDVDTLINELLADYVIDRLDHPVLERLFKPATTAAYAQSEQALDDEEDDYDAY